MSEKFAIVEKGVKKSDRVSGSYYVTSQSMLKVGTKTKHVDMLEDICFGQGELLRRYVTDQGLRQKNKYRYQFRIPYALYSQWKKRVSEKYKIVKVASVVKWT